MMPSIASRYAAKVKQVEGDIKAAFQKQREAKQVRIHHWLSIMIFTAFQIPWSQEDFERLLVNWVVACDQPFTTVEEPEFIKLLRYVHHHSDRVLKIPASQTIQRRVHEMVGDIEVAMKADFEVCFHFFTITCLTFLGRKMRPRWPYLSMHGLQATDMRSWQSWRTGLIMMASFVCGCFLVL